MAGTGFRSIRNGSVYSYLHGNTVVYVQLSDGLKMRGTMIIFLAVSSLGIVMCTVYWYFAGINTSIFEMQVLTHNRSQMENYYCYPCVPKLGLFDHNQCVRTVYIGDDCGLVINCTKFHLKVVDNMTICAHEPAKGRISRRLKTESGWEDGYVQNMIKVLQKNPDMMFFDVGCNIGIYTLVAARMSRRVICVDALYDNLHLVHQSLTLANLTEHVTLIWNALSDRRGVSKLNIVEGDIGMSSLERKHIIGQLKTIVREVPVKTVYLDDLQKLAGGKPVFMKMDVEYFELHVLKGGRRFLKNVDVRYIQMEFNNKADRLQIATLLQKSGLQMYKDVAGKNNIPIDDVPKMQKQHDVYFIKKKT